MILVLERNQSLQRLLLLFLVLALVFTSFSPLASASGAEEQAPEESVLLPYDAVWSYLMKE